MTDAYAAWKQQYPEAAEALLRLTFPPTVDDARRYGPEAAVSAAVRLEASAKGHVLFRNNVGAGTVAESGSFMRWGLLNESERINAVYKSADLIGIERVLITPQHVGCVIGRFLSREIKRSDWKWSGDERERAQLAWANLVLARGGNAAIVAGTGSL